jgi:integrase
MPSITAIQHRDRALFALAILTGMRDGALISLRLKHIDADNEFVNQDPNEVKTKASKQIYTYFTPIGDDLKTIVKDWVKYLRTELLYGNDDPAFPRSKIGLNEKSGFVPVGIEPVCWATAASVRKMMREAYARVGLPYFHPHLLRKTLVKVGEQRCCTPEEFKAWSQNIGHESVLTTFSSYGNVSVERQGELIKGLDGRSKALTPETIREVVEFLGINR